MGGVSDPSVAEVPAGVLLRGMSSDPGDFTGRALSPAPMARGEAISGHRLTDLPQWSVPQGTMPVPVRFADAGAAALLSAGQRVDVVAASGPGLDGAAVFASAELVAQDILAPAVITADQGSGGILGGSTASEEQPPLVRARRRPGSGPGDRRGPVGRASLSYLMHLGPSLTAAVGPTAEFRMGRAGRRCA